MTPQKVRGASRRPVAARATIESAAAPAQPRIVADASGPAPAARPRVDARPRGRDPLREAVYFCTSANESQLPEPGPPEIAFAGRSNVGKSSAINTLVLRKGLAFTSRTPGRTQQINFFRLRGGALLADLPGYGYAAVPKAQKLIWQAFLGRYLATRQTLAGLVLIVDARHGMRDLDRQVLIDFSRAARPVLILANKMDKLAGGARRAAKDRIARDAADVVPGGAAMIRVVAFSALRGIGVDEAIAALAEWLHEDPTSSPATANMLPEPGAPNKRPRRQGE